MPPDPSTGGASANLRGLDSLYDSAPINLLFESRLTLADAGQSRIEFNVSNDAFHAAGAAHGTLYSRCSTMRLSMPPTGWSATASCLPPFNLHFTRPMREGPMIAEGKWISGKRRVFVAEARIVDSEGEECARGTGTFLRSHIALSSLDGYRPR